MRLGWIPAYAVALIVGWAIAEASPAHWGIGGGQGWVVGSALYFGALHRCVEAWRGRRALREARRRDLVLPLVLRGVPFLMALLGALYVLVDVVPQAEVRGPLTILAVWFIAGGIIDPDSHERRA